ncbi:hypothetical protein GCM10010330_35270 [Streptomyces tendae]|nr:hypothetical protein GCM10010330_35270 [Streptomyces tendae]
MTDLAVGGMTCAACVERVEKKPARLDGVSASVNLATGRGRPCVRTPVVRLVGEGSHASSRRG